MDDDVRLIGETLGGRAAAFGQLVQKYQKRLYHAMLYVAGSHEDASDAVQDAFFRAFRKLHRFRTCSTFYTWLYRIAVNEVSNNRRVRKPAASLEHIRETAGVEPVDKAAGPEEQLDRNHRWRQLEKAICGLNEQQRTVLQLRAFDGCRYETIAEILGLPVSTVRGRLYLARMNLRKQLKGLLAVDA